MVDLIDGVLVTDLESACWFCRTVAVLNENFPSSCHLLSPFRVPQDALFLTNRCDKPHSVFDEEQQENDRHEAQTVLEVTDRKDPADDACCCTRARRPKLEMLCTIVEALFIALAVFSENFLAQGCV